MFEQRTHHPPRRLGRWAYAAAVVSLSLAFAPVWASGVARAAPLTATAPGLGAAAAYSVLGKAGVTNVGNSQLSGNVGADLLAAITGFPPGTAGGSLVAAPDVNQAEADASTAALALTAQAGSAVPAGPDLTGVTLVAGVYDVGAAMLPGGLTLDGPGVYIFLASHLTASGSVSLINGASACDVFWHVVSDANINGGSFAGTIIAGTSVTFGDGASLNGRALALTGNVTLINNAISGPNCAAPPMGASHVSVSYACTDDGQVAVTVGLSAGVTVYGLGADITASQDTGENRIVRYLPPGRYEWHATPPAGSFMLDVDHGVIEAAICAPVVLTVAPGSTAAATAGPATTDTPGTTSTDTPTTAATAEATALAVLIPVTGGDQATGQPVRVGLAAVGLGLLALGFGLRRKPASV